MLKNFLFVVGQLLDLLFVPVLNLSLLFGDDELVHSKLDFLVVV